MRYIRGSQTFVLQGPSDNHFTHKKGKKNNQKSTTERLEMTFIYALWVCLLIVNI